MITNIICLLVGVTIGFVVASMFAASPRDDRP
jgi:hypothetical protein